MSALDLLPETRRSPEEERAYGERVAKLVGDETFQTLLQEAGASAVREWMGAQTVQQREAAWQRLQGLRLLEREIVSTADRATRAQRRAST